MVPFRTILYQLGIVTEQRVCSLRELSPVDLGSQQLHGLSGLKQHFCKFQTRYPLYTKKWLCVRGANSGLHGEASVYLQVTPVCGLK